MIKPKDFCEKNLQKVFGGKRNTNVIKTREEELKWIMSNCLDDDNSLFVELGVFKAQTIKVCAEEKPNRTFHGFDSFEGLPEEWRFSKSRIYPRGKAKKKSFWLGQLPNVPENVTLYKGWFKDTLPAWKKDLPQNKYISFLHVDADLYSSTYEGLTILNDLIVKGSIIKFDEFYSWHKLFPDCTNMAFYEHWEDGEYKALNDWMSHYSRDVKPLSRDSHQGATVVVTQ